jgi:hypothetical protein
MVGIGAQFAVYGTRSLTPGLAALVGQSVASSMSEGVRSVIAEWYSAFNRAFDWSRLTAIGDVLQTAFSAARPWNLHDVDISDMEAVAALAMEDGIPVAWVPRAALVRKLVATRPGDERFVLLLEHADEILDDCTTILDEREVDGGYGQRCREAITAHRGGHIAAAQSHATNVVDSLILETFDRPQRRSATDFASVPWLETTLGETSANLALRPVAAAFVAWRVDAGEPVPAKFSRHATVHAAADPAAFTGVTALVAAMLATSLTVEFAPNSGVELESDG